MGRLTSDCHRAAAVVVATRIATAVAAGVDAEDDSGTVLVAQ